MSRALWWSYIFSFFDTCQDGLFLQAPQSMHNTIKWFCKIDWGQRSEKNALSSWNQASSSIMTTRKCTPLGWPPSFWAGRTGYNWSSLAILRIWPHVTFGCSPRWKRTYGNKDSSQKKTLFLRRWRPSDTWTKMLTSQHLRAGCSKCKNALTSAVAALNRVCLKLIPCQISLF